MDEKKYISISKSIEDAIRRNEFGGKLPGLGRLAEIYESNPRTVSKALRLLEEKGKVTVNGTRGTYISGINQRPRFRVIGLIGMRSTGGYRNQLETIQNIAAKEHYRVIALSDSRDLDALLRENSEFLLNFPVDGFIFAYSSITENIAAALRGAGIPFVAMNYVPDIPGVNWAAFSSERGLERILKELTALGHHRIALVEFNNHNYGYSEKMYRLYRDFLSSLNSFDKRYYYSHYTMQEHYMKHGENSYREFAREIVEYIAALKTRPSAVIFMNAGNSTIINACDFFRMTGIRIPEDISITGDFDMRDKCKISGLLYDYSLRASEAAKIIMKLLKYPDTPLAQKTLVQKWHPGRTVKSVNHCEKNIVERKRK